MSESPFTPESTLDSEKDHLRERILNQDAELMRAVNIFANKVQSVPHDPKCPDVQPKAYLAGGFVRDAILGKHPKDADLEVYGISQDRLKELLDQLFEGQVNTTGKDFTVYKVNIGDGLDFDISMPRRDSKVGPTRRDFKVTGDPTMTTQEASGRRDFTINAMLADPLTGEIIDQYHGIEDLEHRILRVVDRKTFIEDPIRVYRALQFVGRMNLSVDPDTMALLKEMVDQGTLDTLSKEKTTEEIRKLLEKSPKPSIGFELAKELGIIDRYYPELAGLEATPQEADWHPEGNVWIHTMMVVDKAAQIVRDPAFEIDEDQRLEVLLGALCHDLGKPATTKESDGRIRSHGHEAAGKAPAKKLLSKWMFGKAIDHAAIAVTVDHLSPFQYVRSLEKGDMDERSFSNAVRRLIKRIHPCSWKTLVAVCAADIQGRGGDAAVHMEEAQRMQELFSKSIKTKQLDVEPKKKLIRGEDVMAYGIKQGTEIGAIINKIEEMRDNGEITTREEGLEALKRIVSPCQRQAGVGR